jgi:hypothetical protein
MLGVFIYRKSRLPVSHVLNGRDSGRCLATLWGPSLLIGREGGCRSGDRGHLVPGAQEAEKEEAVLDGVEVKAVFQSPWTANCRGAESQWPFDSRPGGSVAEEKGHHHPKAQNSMASTAPLRGLKAKSHLN